MDKPAPKKDKELERVRDRFLSLFPDKKGRKGKFDREKALALGIPSSTFNDICNKGRIPGTETFLRLGRDADLSWIITGRKRASFTLEQIPRPYCAFVGNLREIPKDLRTEDYMTIPLVEGSIAAGEPIISPEKIEGFAVIHVTQIGRRTNLVAIRVDERTGKSMEPLIRHGSMIAIDRDDREIIRGKVYAVRVEGGATIKFVQRDGDILIMVPANPDRETYPVQILDLKGLTYDPIIGRVIWNWQTL